jgi:hypothetical protein
VAGSAKRSFFDQVNLSFRILFYFQGRPALRPWIGKSLRAQRLNRRQNSHNLLGQSGHGAMVAYPAGGHPAMAGPLQHPVWLRLCQAMAPSDKKDTKTGGREI